MLTYCSHVRLLSRQVCLSLLQNAMMELVSVSGGFREANITAFWMGMENLRTLGRAWTTREENFSG